MVNYRVWYLLAIPTVAVLFVFALPVLLTVLCFLVSRARSRPRKMHADPPRFTMPPATRRDLTLRDGIRLTYYVIRGRHPDRVMVFAAGIGCASSFRYWAAPVVQRFGDDFTYIYWDYRGLFDSQQPKLPRRFAVIEHAEDLNEILCAEGIDRIDVLLGHSMGGMVALEFCAIHPSKVDSLIIANSGHGKVFSSALQPLCRIPFMSRFLQRVCMLVGQHLPAPQNEQVDYVTESAPWKFFWDNVRGALQMYVHFFGSDSLKAMIGPNYLSDFLEIIVLDTLRHPLHIGNFMLLFEEMDSWSIYHLLPRITTPVLIIAGLWDPVTPAYASYEMDEMLPNSKLITCFLSSHVSLLEQPGFCMRHIDEFVARRTPSIQFYPGNDVDGPKPRAR